MDFSNVNMHGQVTLPAGIRKKLGINAGAVLSIENKDDEIILRKARMVEESVLKELAELAKNKKITKNKIVAACKRIGDELYKNEYEQ